MEFDDILVKESPGLCRCCLSEGCYKDLGKEYTWMNENEVYADMLLECFDISISQHNEGPNGPNRLICEVCITRLRDACNFKKQVLDSEKKFIDMVGRGEFRPKVLIYQAQMKAENEEVVDEVAEVEYLEDDMEFGDDELIKPSDNPEPSVSEDITVTTLPVKNKRGRPKKNASPVKPEKKKKLEDKARTSKAIVKDAKVRDQRLKDAKSEENEKIILRENLVKLLEHTTGMPFRKYGNKYRCFYCNSSYHNASDLRNHTTKHQNVNKTSSVKKSVTQLLVKLDITDLQCKICSRPVEGLDNLIDHLQIHNAHVDKAILQYIMPFKLSDGDLKCLVCNESFSFFGPLLLHTHREHIRRGFICEKCGVGFGSKGAIDRHSESVHPTNTYECRYCDKKFFAVHRRASHEKRIHDINERKCPICEAVLGSIYKKETHLATVHNVWSSEFVCELCSKKFRYRHLLLSHNRRIHLKEKKVVCEVCGDKFFDRRLLKLHMARHSDLKPYECGTCQKRFPRKCGLIIHTRIHTNDRRYRCKMCEKAFVQFASLKLHMKIHHKDSVK